MTDTLPLPPTASPDWAWFLDVDGTLINIAPTPSAIVMPVELPAMLQRLSDAAGGAVALVTGRTLDNLHHLMTPFDPPAAGLHGLEWRDASGTQHRHPVPPGLDDIHARLSRLAERTPGLLLEDKGQAVALHYRQAPELKETLAAAVAEVVRDQPGYTVMAGKMVYEIKPKGIDKGRALRAFMETPPFAGRRPVFVGDDTTDEYGFAAANELGGLSVLVGHERPTEAHYRLYDVESCRAWIAKAAGIEWVPHEGEGGD